MPAGYIDRPTADKLARLADAADAATWERDVAITEAMDAGISHRTISRVVRIDPTTLRRIAKRTHEALAGERPKSRRESYLDPDSGSPHVDEPNIGP